MRRATGLLTVFLATGIAGCTSTATLDGMVRYQGKTVTSGSVIVVNEDGTAESGVIKPDGSYSVDNVKRGHVRIGVASPDPSVARSILKPQQKPPKGKARQPGKPADATWF